MRKRYVVLLDSSTAAQHEAFLAWVKQAGLGWWHWLSGSWLLTDSNGDFSGEQLRDKVREVFDDSYCLVLELRADGTDTWNGFGTTAEGKNFFPWLHDNWK